MPSWPAGLPQYVLPEQYRETPPMPVAEVEMDAGAPKTFGTGTDEGRTYGFQIPLDGAQVEILDLFYRSDLRDGELDFDWVLPREQTAALFGFLTTPTYRHLDGDNYVAAMLLETRDTTKSLGFRSRSFSAATAKVSTGAALGFASASGSHIDVELE